MIFRKTIISKRNKDNSKAVCSPRTDDAVKLHANVRISFAAKIAAAAGIIISGLALSSQTSYAKDIFVSPTGILEYETIGEAVSAAESGDRIVIFPGTYEESIVVEDKTLYFYGTDRENCILTNDTENYLTPPLMLPSGSVQNLTIIARKAEIVKETDEDTKKSEAYEKDETNENKGIGAIEGKKIDEIEEAADPRIKEKSSTEQDSILSYAIHIDSDNSQGKSILISNCTIISECSHAIGVGLRQGFTLSISDCSIEATIARYPIFIHDSSANYKGDASVYVKNCDLHSYGGYMMAFVTFDGDNNKTHLYFDNLDISDTGGVYLVVNKNKKIGDGIGGSTGFYLESGIESDPTIVTRKTIMPCSVWSSPETKEEARRKRVGEGYEIRIYPNKVVSASGDGKEFYRTVKGSYILCRCVDEECESE